MATLDRNKFWDNTIVVLMGDHGYHLGEHGWWLKFAVFELCASAPFVVWAPDAKSMGRSTKGIVEFIDLYPTLADLCAVPLTSPLEGAGFRHLLNDPSLPGKQAAYTQTTRGELMGRSVRTARWRYTEWDNGRSGIEFYDHTTDSLEYYNQAEQPELQSVIDELKPLLHKPNR